MSTQLYTDCNVYARRFDWVNELGLGTKTYGDSEERVSNTVGLPANLQIELVAGLASGTGLDIEVFLSDEDGPDLEGSPDATLSLSTTVVQELSIPLTDAKRYVTLRCTDGGGGCVLAKNKLEASDLMPLSAAGLPQGYHEAVGGFNKVPQTTNYAPANFSAVAVS